MVSAVMSLDMGHLLRQTLFSEASESKNVHLRLSLMSRISVAIFLRFSGRRDTREAMVSIKSLSLARLRKIAS